MCVYVCVCVCFLYIDCMSFTNVLRNLEYFSTLVNQRHKHTPRSTIRIPSAPRRQINSTNLR